MFVIKKWIFSVLLCLAGLSLCAGAGAVAKIAYETEPPVPQGYKMPYTLTVYLENQMVVAYHADSLKPARVMICSSGTGSKTPRGTFTMPSTYTSSWDKWGNVYVRFPTRIRGSIYFHSILYNASNKSLNMESWNKLGQKASHGCVRLTPLDAQWINYNCKKGTRVRIVNARGEGLAELHKKIKDDLRRGGIASVQPTLRPTPTPTPPTIDENSGKTSAVKGLQTKLRSHGFYAGPVSGVFDSATVAAWNAYQASQGWAQDSVATTEEQIHLASDEETVAFNVPLKSGSESIVVKQAEQRLKALGFFTGTPNRKYDAATVSAVKAFQKAGALPVTGKLPCDQQSLLFSEAAPTPTPFPDLTIGNNGSLVKKLQQRLYSLGFYAGSATGKYQAATRAAVSAYQKAAGLPVTGTASASLRAMVQTDDTHIGTARTLKLKSKGVVVKALEDRLVQLGLYGAAPDTVYDAMTVRAVKSFQRAHDLTVTGIATGAVQKMIFES